MLIQIKNFYKRTVSYFRFLFGFPAIQIDKKFTAHDLENLFKKGDIYSLRYLLPSYIIGKRRFSRSQSLLLILFFVIIGSCLSFYFDSIFPALFILGITIILDSGTVFENGSLNEISIASMDGTHFVIAFNDVGDGSKGKVIAGSVSGVAITISANNPSVYDNSSCRYSFICRMDDTHFAIAFNDVGDGSKGKVIAGSISGTTITIIADSGVNYSTEDPRYNIILSMDSTHFVIAFNADDDSGKGKVIAGSLSGTTITITEDAGVVFETGPPYELAATMINSTHFVIAFRDTGNGGKGTVIAGSLSGTTITITADTGVIYCTSNTYKNALVRMSDTHFVIVYRDGGSQPRGRVVAATLSGVTITVTADSGVGFETDWTYSVSACGLDSEYFLIVYADFGTGQTGKVVYGKLSGTTISLVLNSGVEFTSAGVAFTSIDRIDDTHFIIAYPLSGGTEYGYVIAGIADFSIYSPNLTNRKNWNGYLAFVQQYVKHKLDDTPAWMHPDGYLFD